MDILIKAGADVNSDYGIGALFQGISVGTVECVKLLLEAGADVNGTTVGSRLLLHAVKYQQSGIIELILQLGTDVNSIDSQGNTALSEVFSKDLHDCGIHDCGHWFVDDLSDDALNCCKILLRAGIKVNVTNNHGYNILTRFLRSVGRLYRLRLRKQWYKFMMLLYAAGETVDESKVETVPDYLKPSSEEICLKNICREAIREHLLQISDINLFPRVSQLPLPQLMTSYLLYDVTLDDDEETNEDICSDTNSDSENDGDSDSDS